MTRTYRGIVCEKKDKYVIFLTNSGEFLRGIPLGMDPEIGEETEFHLFKSSTLHKKWTKPSVLAPVLVAAVFLIFVITSFIPNPSTALAYVQLDADNAVELGVNKYGKVVTLRSLNENNSLLLEDLEGGPFDYVFGKVITQISPTTEKIAVTTVYKKNKKTADLRKLIELAFEEVQNEPTGKVLIIKESTTKERKEANKNNISIQKLKQTKNEKEDIQTNEDNKQSLPLKEPEEKETLKEQEELIEKQQEQNEQVIEKQQKEQVKKLENIQETKEKELEEQQELKEKEAEELEKAREQKAEELEKQREQKAEELEKLREEEAKRKEKEQEENEENDD